MSSRHPTLLILTGPSSAGKTTIATRLQMSLRQKFWHVGHDAFVNMAPPRERLDPTNIGAASLLSFNAAFSLLSEKQNVILDGVLPMDVVNTIKEGMFAETKVLSVLIFAPAAVLRAREAGRPSRDPEWRDQWRRFQKRRDFDVCIDTSQGDATQNAQKLVRALSPLL